MADNNTEREPQSVSLAHPPPTSSEYLLPYLRRKRELCQLVLYAWSEVEFHLDQVVTRQFGLYPEDEQAKRYVMWRFIDKIKFLREKGLITDTEFKELDSFRAKRNILFHRDGLAIMHLMTEKERDEVMDMALKAAQLSLAIGFRVSKDGTSGLL